MSWSKKVQTFQPQNYSIRIILNWIRENQIAIPEIQRPFVWKPSRVRDLIDSLYQGYPIGYLITWQNPNVRLTDGSIAIGKRILIDGQQRVISLKASLLGGEVVTRGFKHKRITIAFHPIEKRFEVLNNAIKGDPKWINDVSTLFTDNFNPLAFIRQFCEQNEGIEEEVVFENIQSLLNIESTPVGVIELEASLDVETVTEIFIRINSKGVALNASDFVMSKIAASEEYEGSQLRKCIDYFSHLATSPAAINNVRRDTNFAKTEYFSKIQWLENAGNRNDIYVPSYTDMLRVIFMTGFQRAQLRDLVALLSGRDFETQEFREDVVEDSFRLLKKGINEYVNQHRFENFVMILRSAGFVDNSMINAMNAVNFAYGLFLMLHSKEITGDNIERLVRRWFVMSVLTSRYSASVETTFDQDIRNIVQHGLNETLETIERTELSDIFWNERLPQEMQTSSQKNPYFYVFLASQVIDHDKGCLSKNMTVQNLLEGQKDRHHIFPRKYLQSQGLVAKDYNQIANLVVMQRSINISIGSEPPATYLKKLQEGCRSGEPPYGVEIENLEELQTNLNQHCIPSDMETADLTFENYNEFLGKRRKLMAAKIRQYYESL
ncbi:hypothetical protein C6497_17225 [Candidatus Poribacteria bacterium]|nr:MAG: hypothetical protein C6497_17225 [Candidatus Poribacteria bacterium]